MVFLGRISSLILYIENVNKLPPTPPLFCVGVGEGGGGEGNRRPTPRLHHPTLFLRPCYGMLE